MATLGMQMTDITIVEGFCRNCKETLPLSAFTDSVKQKLRNGASTGSCALCNAAATRNRREKRRKEIGDEAFWVEEKAKVARSRANTGDAAGKRSRWIYGRASTLLREAHPRQFKYFQEIAKREWEQHQ